MNDNINMDRTIAGSMNDNINMVSTIAGSMNDNINMDNTIFTALDLQYLTMTLKHFVNKKGEESNPNGKKSETIKITFPREA